MRGSESTTAYVGLGANLGDREATIRAAVERLADEPGITVRRVSTLRETEPVGPIPDQPAFLNGVAELETSLPATDLLEALLRVERGLGRTREGPAGGPRPIDLDLLLYGQARLEAPGLVVPHPRLHERRFVLEPLHELAPGLKVPGKGTVAGLLAGLN